MSPRTPLVSVCMCIFMLFLRVFVCVCATIPITSLFFYAMVNDVELNFWGIRKKKNKILEKSLLGQPMQSIILNEVALVLEALFFDFLKLLISFFPFCPKCGCWLHSFCVWVCWNSFFFLICKNMESRKTEECKIRQIKKQKKKLSQTKYQTCFLLVVLKCLMTIVYHF